MIHYNIYYILSSFTTHSVFPLPSASTLAGRDSFPGGVAQLLFPKDPVNSPGLL